MRLGLKREHRFHFWHRTLKRYQKDLQNAPFWAPFGHPGRPNAAFGPFWGQPKISCFFGEGPDAHFGPKIAPKWPTHGATFRPLFGTLFQRVPPSVKSTLKVTFFIKKYHSFLMFFCIKHIKKTLCSDSAGSDWLSLTDTWQVKFTEQITSSKYTAVICSVNLTCQVSPSYSFHWFFLFCSMS